MRIALFSDIHAKLPLLEAFFINPDKQKTNVIYCLGDLAGYNIWHNEVINDVRKRSIPTIAGITSLVLDVPAMIVGVRIQRMLKRQTVQSHETHNQVK